MVDENLTEDGKVFVLCEKCSKILIERKQNGLWYFRFGWKKQERVEPYVEMFIQGNIRMKCLRRACGHWNILNFLPFSNSA